MIVLNYCKYGARYSDFDLEEIVFYYIKKGGDVFLDTSTENIINMFQVLIAEKMVPSHKVKFLFNGELVKHDLLGRFEDLPRGFCELGYSMGARMLIATSKRDIDKYFKY